MPALPALIPLLDLLAGLLLAAVLGAGLWAAWRWAQPQVATPRDEPPTLWDLAHVDDDGVLRFSVVRVLHVDMAGMRMVGWCTRSQTQRVFRLSRVLKATHVATGRRVRLPRSVLLNPESHPQVNSGSTNLHSRRQLPC